MNGARFFVNLHRYQTSSLNWILWIRTWIRLIDAMNGNGKSSIYFFHIRLAALNGIRKIVLLPRRWHARRVCMQYMQNRNRTHHTRPPREWTRLFCERSNPSHSISRWNFINELKSNADTLFGFFIPTQCHQTVSGSSNPHSFAQIEFAFHFLERKWKQTTRKCCRVLHSRCQNRIYNFKSPLIVGSER